MIPMDSARSTTLAVLSVMAETGGTGNTDTRATEAPVKDDTVAYGSSVTFGCLKSAKMCHTHKLLGIHQWDL